MTKPITSSQDLEQACLRLSRHDHIAVDTEFMRETTYYPKICLIQLASNDEAVAIDPLAEGLNLAPLFELMQDPQVLKVFHSARQDLEIFVHLMGELPRPCYDTQIAGMVCGFGDQAGYDKLVKGFLNIDIDKASQFTDWSQRPLSKKQILYALDDVIYLNQIFPLIRTKIEDLNRTSWLEEEMATLDDLSVYQVKADEVWRKIKHRNGKPAMLNRLKHLAAWRERTAQRRDVPKGRLIKDDALLAIANSNPASAEAIGKIRGFYAGKKFIPEILNVLKKAANTPKDQWPQPASQPSRKPSPAVVELLRLLLKHTAEQNDIAPRLIANAATLEQIALGQSENIKAMQGWRYDIFGQYAEQIIQGKMAITLKKAKTHLVKL